MLQITFFTFCDGSIEIHTEFHICVSRVGRKLRVCSLMQGPPVWEGLLVGRKVQSENTLFYECRESQNYRYFEEGYKNLKSYPEEGWKLFSKSARREISTESRDYPCARKCPRINYRRHYIKIIFMKTNTNAYIPVFCAMTYVEILHDILPSLKSVRILKIIKENDISCFYITK